MEATARSSREGEGEEESFYTVRPESSQELEGTLVETLPGIMVVAEGGQWWIEYYRYRCTSTQREAIAHAICQLKGHKEEDYQCGNKTLDEFTPLD